MFCLQALEKWMNESTNGFIYFSFGSMVLIETFPLEFLNILYSSFSKIAPVRVLMKVPNPDKLPPGLPKNIYMSSWMPQIKVLSTLLFLSIYNLLFIKKRKYFARIN